MTYQPQTYRYFLLTLDPVHIGTGGARLGRVDNPIVREPGTRLPKIPGSSLHGMIRAYAAYRYGKPRCAGQGKNHCAQPTCPICYTFGHARDKAGGRAGVVAISDARILLFPVYSMVGPVWVTSPGALQDAGLGEHQVKAGQAKWGGGDSELPTNQHLNLGWLMVEREGNFPSISWPNEIPDQIKNRVVLVSDKLFSQIVNSNLEVRTSVAINPHTGAAEEGALFTYEAIPRATVLWMDVVVSDYRGAFPNKERWQEICQHMEETLPGEIPDTETETERALRQLGYISKRPSRGNDESEAKFKERQNMYWKQVREAQEACKHALQTLEWNTPSDLILFGLEWAEHLGVGGMGTRGFGRIREVACWEVTSKGELQKKCEKQTSPTDTENTEQPSP